MNVTSGITMAGPKVVVIVLNWNNAPDTEQCLISLLEQEYQNIEILVVDNGSTDGSGKAIASRFAGNPKIEFLFLNQNTGFAAGNNAGIRKATAANPTYLLILNNDVKVTKTCISILVEAAASDGRIGIVGAANLYLHDPAKIWYSGGNIDWNAGRFVDETADSAYDPGDSRIREVDDVAGSSMLIKRSVVEAIGLMWEPYFLYFEESDWCLRAKKAGFKVVATMGATVYHKVHASIQGDAETYYLNRNYPVFLLRNCPPRTLPKALWSYLSKSARTYRESSTVHDGRQVAVLREAFWDFVSHQLGERRKRSILG